MSAACLMPLQKTVITLTLVVFLGPAASAFTEAWDEISDGDFSNDPLSPTPVEFTTGANRVTGFVIPEEGDVRDYFTFTLSPGESMGMISLVEYTDLAIGGNGNIGYMQIDSGTASVIPDVDTIVDFLGGWHISVEGLLPGFNVLERMAGADRDGGVGFSTPLGPGDYVINVQQTGSEPTLYVLDFMIVPEPNPFAAFAVAAVGFLFFRRRQRRSARPMN